MFGFPDFILDVQPGIIAAVHRNRKINGAATLFLGLQFIFEMENG
jgi:hypothetical protein